MQCACCEHAGQVAAGARGRRRDLEHIEGDPLRAAEVDGERQGRVHQQRRRLRWLVAPPLPPPALDSQRRFLILRAQQVHWMLGAQVQCRCVACVCASRAHSCWHIRPAGALPPKVRWRGLAYA